MGGPVFGESYLQWGGKKILTADNVSNRSAVVFCAFVVGGVFISFLQFVVLHYLIGFVLIGCVIF